MKPLLLTIDLQNDFLRKPGLEPAAGEVVAGATRLLEAFRSRSLPVIHVHTTVDRSADNRMPHWKAAGLWQCVAGSEGHETPASLRPAEDEPVIHKSFFSAFSTGELDTLLARQACDTLVVCGVHLHGCVRQTVIDAYQKGFAVWVADDAVGYYSPIGAAESRQYLQGRAASFAATGAILDSIDGVGRSNLEVARECVHRSPRDPKRTWTVRIDSAEEIDGVARRAYGALSDWRCLDVKERASIFMSIAEQLDLHREELVSLVVEEIGKPIRMAAAEVDAMSQMIRAVVRRFGDGAWSGINDDYRRVPLGVIATVTPWNNPLYIPAGKIVPALILGNAVVWKPSPQAFQAASRLREEMCKRGVPHELLGVVSGDDRTAREVMNHPLVAAVSLTGSSAAGYAAQHACAARRIPLQAELGGNNAALVWQDADLDLTANSIARGAFEFAGQRCTATRRAVVHESVYEQFLQRVEEAATLIPFGDPREEQTRVGPVISAEKAMRIESLLSRAEHDADRITRVSSKAFLTLRKRSECYVRPAVVCCDQRESEIVQEESFGPVLVVQRAKDWKDAVDLCNAVRQGLAASLFARGEDVQRRFLHEIETGIVKLNQPTSGADVDVPFGGWKSSGLGPPEHGAFDLEFYTRPQAVYR